MSAPRSPGSAPRSPASNKAATSKPAAEDVRVAAELDAKAIESAAEDLSARLARAKEDTLIAEKELDKAVRAIVEMPRHQKVAVSKLVETALARVKVVRIELSIVEELTVAALGARLPRKGGAREDA